MEGYKKCPTMAAMAIRVFNLRNAGDDEVEELCELLAADGIDAYLTPPGPWGISAPGLWVRQDEDADRARALIATYQQQRGERVREEYRQLRAAGQAETLGQRLRARPLQVLAALAVIVLLLYVTLKPFVDLARGQ